MRELLPENRPILALAPMQDVTDLPFMKVMHEFGGPDYYVTEYFRVYPNSRLEKHIVPSITENPTGKPVFAQMIGQDPDALVATATQLQELPIAGVDINLGCPAPVVCRKDAGGGLLRYPDRIDRILGALRDCVKGRFTVKTRVGYETMDEFQAILDVFARHEIDALAIHGRTVKERYQTPVHEDCVKQAVDTMPCPVIANGNVVNVDTGRAYHAKTNAAGLMIGRGAIRHPWIFDQLRASFAGEEIMMPTRQDLRRYVQLLFDETAAHWEEYEPRKHTNKMKKYMVYIAQGLDEEFEYQIRRAQSPEEFHAICDDFMSAPVELPDLPPEKSKLFCGFSGLLEK